MLVFLVVVLLTVFSGAAVIYLGVQPQLSDEGKRMVETFSTTWKLGFGAIVGLIAGKSLP